MDLNRGGIRRSHKKSKNGCHACKRRHMKCDESRPSCVNCLTAGLACPFVDGKSPVTRAASSDRSPSEDIDAMTRRRFNIGDFMVADPTTESSINIAHLELFHNFMFRTCKSFFTSEEHVQIYQQTAVSSAFAYPFLMHGIMALSALHLSIEKPNQKEVYRHMAASLLDNGLAGFDDMLTRINADNCLAILIFSHVIGVHTFCDTFLMREGDFGAFLTRLTHTINILRGVQAITNPWGHVLFGSDIGRIMGDTHARRSELKALKSQGECQGLISLLQTTDISESSREIYAETARRLQSDFDADDRTNGPLSSISTTFAWLYATPKEYTDLLAERRPEALVLLAYYSLILHKRRKSWVIQDAGEFLVTSISTYLGERWDNWMAWPKENILLR